MIMDARHSENDESDANEPVPLVVEEAMDSVDAVAGTSRQPDIYAAAELLRRRERTESIIQKAREQFA